MHAACGDGEREREKKDFQLRGDREDREREEGEENILLQYIMHIFGWPLGQQNDQCNIRENLLEEKKPANYIMDVISRLNGGGIPISSIASFILYIGHVVPFPLIVASFLLLCVCVSDVWHWT